MASTAGPVARFTAVGAVVLLALAALIAMAAREAGTEQAAEAASQVTWVTARGVVEPRLDAGVISGDPAALAAFHQAMRAYVLQGSLVRVKLWDAGGRVIYSDEPRLMRARYGLEAGELEALRQQRTASAVSDLSRPENQYESAYGKLLEVYVGVRAATGEPLLFEAYFRYDAVTEAGLAVWRKFAPIALGALFVLQLVQIPLAASLARRVQRQQRERESLLRHAVDASDAERRRIAGELHDGVVQQLTGITYALDAARLGRPDEARRAEVISQAATDLRSSIGSLRSLLVDIYPPNLVEEGLASALAELASGLERTGIRVDLDTAGAHALPPVTAGLLYRTAQEAVRNVAEHSLARRVEITVAELDGRARLTVDDDGRGFDSTHVGGRTEGGHFGLRALSDLIHEANGRLVVRSAPGAGTRVEAEVPIG
ncbi:sensor histidine kinase [Actinophytocola sp.]|uniref:sensor histidine kinase n=1 Tax=Actinophytocola sp. TaxID=1872138 RepID=UPI002D7F879F|nr:sensor histidine kinase [Actinophytocola sp.]HET9142475.1 sensor histidine kinase [Actinophytocola sp.]